ncbi:hypothetical protein [Bradyrhizobium sp. 23AC]
MTPDFYGLVASGSFTISDYIIAMDIEYDPEREAVAAMKLAADADGAERQRWIILALAWQEIARVPGPPLAAKSEQAA